LIGPLVAVTATLSLVTIPFLVICREQFLYGIIGVHVSAGTDSVYHFGILSRLGALSELIRSVPILVFCTIPVVLALAFREFRSRIIPSGEERAAWVAVGLISLAHLAANWCHASYQIVVLPLWTVLVAVGIGRFLEIPALAAWRKPVVVMLLAGGCFTVLSQGRNFIWYTGQGAASPFLEEVASKVAGLTSSYERILTDQPLIAHQAKRVLTHGFEGAPFTYTPSWDTGKCLRFATVNDEMLRGIIENHLPGMLALTPQSFRMASPGFYFIPEERHGQLWEMIDRHYQPVAKFERFAGTADTLTLYLPRKVTLSPQDVALSGDSTIVPPPSLR
jgi:hypothetical protein